EDGTPFIVMELLEGEDLYQRLCRVRKLPLPEVIEIARQVGSALHAAHEKGIVHRDVKPQNIFLVRHEIAEMVTEVAKVVDFGISKIRRTGGQMTRDMTLLGTPQFMSPEAALGQNSALDGRADQWSLAVIMYLCLTGRLPFDSENPVGVLYMVVHEKPVPIKQLAPDLPDHIVAAIEKAMSKRKDDRFPRMVDFVKAVLGQTQAAPSRLNLAPAKATDAQPAQAVERPRVQPSPQPARPLPAALPSVGHMPTGPGAVPAKPGPIGGTPTPQFDPPTVPQTTPSLLPAPTKLAPVRTPSAPSGNTPTNIVLNDAEMQALLSRSATTPVSNDAAAADFEQVPTRLVGNNDPTPPVPEPGLKAPSLDKPFDPYPSTLSRATGQQSISTGGALVDGSEVTGKNPPVGLLLSTIGVNPRSNLRLGLSGAAIVVCIAILIWLLSGGDSKEQVASGPPAITDTKTASESPDAGISDDKTGGKNSGPTGRAPGGSSPSGSPSKRPTAKPTDTGSKRIKIDPGV
ncbi:MAG TPA: protein kinase, partial [Pseudomonadota bacterium]|nr:protein kinase [Pseudomonadota bacterium]